LTLRRGAAYPPAMFRKLRRRIRKLLGSGRPGEPGEFEDVAAPGVRRRKYDSYDSYLRHQAEKLPRRIDRIRRSDAEYEQVVRGRFAQAGDFRGKTVLCLAARLGGEVRAFKALGALAVGIDIAPGTDNPHVLHGDFHDIQFPDGCFDVAFTNSIDHVYDLDRFLREVVRVLKPAGSFYLECAEVNPRRYEVLDTSDSQAILDKVREFFDVDSEAELVNETSYVNWPGRLYRLAPKAGE
jgi:SAM-dependent methyltransferase